QALGPGEIEQGRRAQREGCGPRIRHRRLPVRCHFPASGTIAGTEGAAPRLAQDCDVGIPRALADQKAGACAEFVTSGTSAGFGRRLAALLYDSVLLAALLVVFTSGAVFLNHRVAVEPATAGAWAYLYRAGLIGVIAGYYLLNWTRSGQTLGMRAWHLRAVSPSGQPLAWKAAALPFVLGVLAW